MVQEAGFGLTFLLFAAVFVLKQFLTPKPKTENARPTAIGDFSFPTATEDRKVPLIWGTVKLEGPNVVWYGDLKQKPIKQTQKTGLFSSTTTTIGFKYFVGIQFGLCLGPIDSLRRIWIKDKEVFNGIQAAGTIAIDEPKILGGQKFGQGGIKGTLRVHIGDETQVASTYLSKFQKEPPTTGDTPAYRGICYCTWEKGYIGNSSSIEPWKFEVRRIPNGLALSGGKEIVNSADANPMNVIYELMTNNDWGLGILPADIDLSNFTTNADTLFTEGNGFSMVLDTPREAVDMLKEVERQIDGIVFFNRSTGDWQTTLARPGQASQGTADETNVVKIDNFSRGAWEETSNTVNLSFVDRGKDYFATTALAQDIANVRILSANVTVDVNYPGVRDADLATNIVWRELRTLSRPLAKATLTLDRTFYALNPGDIFEWSNAALGIVALDVRVTKVDIGEPNKGRIVVTVVEDIFSDDLASFATPQPTGWTEPSDDMVDIPTADRVVFEAPKAFVDRDPLQPGVPNRIWAGARSQDLNEVQFDIAASGITEGVVSGFLLAGKLNAAVTRDSTATITIKPDPDLQSDMLDEFTTISNTDKGVSLAQLVMVNDEFIAVTDGVTSGLNVDLTVPTRGMLDTTPAEHAADDICYLLFVAGNLTDGTFTSSPVSVELLPESPSDKLTTADATAFNVTMANRTLKPYPPVRPVVAGGEYTAATVSLDSAVSAADDGSGFTLDFTRRDYRTSDEYLAQLNESTLPGDFPAANTTEYRVEVIEDPAGSPVSLFTTPWATGDGTALAISRTEILANNAAVVPATLRVEVQTRHTVDSTVYEAGQVLQWDFDTDSDELDAGDTNLGVLATNATSATFTAVTAANHTLTIGANVITGGFAVQARVNVGSWVNIITAGGTTGSIGVLSISDTVEIRHTQTASGVDTICLLDDTGAGDTAEAWAILQV